MKEKDPFDLWWEWAQKPHESFLMIDADIHRPIMELSPEDRREGQRSLGVGAIGTSERNVRFGHLVVESPRYHES